MSFEEALAKLESMEEPPATEAPAEEEPKQEAPAAHVEGEQAETPEPVTADAKKTEQDEFIEFSGKQKERFNKVYGNMKRLEREHAYLLSEVQKFQQLQAQKPVPPTSFSEPKPILSQFEDADKWADAVAEWSARKARFELEPRLVEQRQQIRQQLSQDEAVAREQQIIDSKMAQGYSKYPDFEEVSHELGLVATPAMRTTLFNLENFAPVAYELGRNLAEAERIARLPVHRQIYEIQAMEQRLVAKQQLKNQPKPTPTKVEAPGQGEPAKSSSLSKLKRAAFESGDLRDFAKIFELEA